MMAFDITHPNSGSKTRSFTRTRAEQEKAAGYRETKEHLVLFVCDLVWRKEQLCGKVQKNASRGEERDPATRGKKGDNTLKKSIASFPILVPD